MNYRRYIRSAKTLLPAALLTLGMVQLAGCTEDLGSYDYKELNDITIDTIYNQQVSVFDVLHIDATVHQSQHQDNDNIAYTWYYYKNSQATVADTISHDAVLDYSVVMEPGEYQFYVTATDSNTGLWKKRAFKVKVTGQFSGGLLMLGDGEEGRLSLGFVSFSTASKGKIVSIYNEETGEKIGRNPVALGKSASEILVLCNDADGGSALVSGTMTRSRSFSDMFMFRPENMQPQMQTMISNPFGAARGYTELAIVGGSAHYRQPNGESFSPALSGKHDFAGYAYMMRNNIILYDNQDGAFMRKDFGFFGEATTLDIFPEPEEGYDAFDPNNLGLKAVTMSMGRSKSGLAPSLCGIFRNNAGENHVVYMGVDYSAMDGLLAMPMYCQKVTEATLPDFNKATAYSSYDSNNSILYYAAGSRIYMYNYETKLPATVFLNLEDLGFKGCSVTCMKLNSIDMGDMAIHTGTGMYIAVSNEGDKSSKAASIIHVVLRDDYSGMVKEVADVWKNVSSPIVSMLIVD